MNPAARWTVLLALCGLTVFFRLGGAAITDSDEAYYAEAGREMVETGDWVTPQFNYEPRLEKPVFYYWLVAATYKVAGVGEAQARLFSGLAAIGLVAIAYLVGRRWIGPPQGLLAGAIIATSFGVFWMARSALPDLPLAFFLTLGTWALIEATAGDAAHPRRWLLLAALSLALAFLTKGPVAFAVPAVVIVPLWLWERRTGTRSGVPYRLRISIVDLLLASALMAAIITPWLALIMRAHPDYFWRLFVTESLERFGTTKYNQIRFPGFFVPVLLTDFATWSPFFLLWVKPGWAWIRRRRPLSRVEARLLLSAGAPFLLFSISIGSQPRYILPCLVPCAVLLARTIRAKSLTAAIARERLFSTAGVLSGLTIIGIGVLLHHVSTLTDVYPNWSGVPSTVAMIAGALVILAALQGSRRLPEVLVVASVALLIAITQTLTPPRPEPVEAMSAAILADQPDVVCACGAFGKNLPLYSRHKIVAGATKEEILDVLTRTERVHAAVDSEMLPKVEEMIGRPLRRLRDLPYLNLGEPQLDLLLPSPIRKVLERVGVVRPGRIQHVILVSNR